MFTNTLSKNATNALALLGRNKILPVNTYLAGGSALALHFGHRVSVDFDFFTNAHFESEMPKMIESISWKDVKKFFEREAVRLGKKYLTSK